MSELDCHLFIRDKKQYFRTACMLSLLSEILLTVLNCFLTRISEYISDAAVLV